ncbi:Shedu anti-phage system protein SduA domain-containing protein [Kitasatospora griseola]|uniref:Shedu anti-phage system protein SduA domain-containing protein n=1 Tax=Kitasatospora griseola TaxID=2064 RepID=UPI0037F88A90
MATSAVHESVSQCMNYLRTIDEMGASLRTLHSNELGLNYDYRRARGTVVIGYPDRDISARSTKEQIDQTIRSYNSRLSRIQVLTYAGLLDSAERALSFEETPR